MLCSEGFWDRRVAVRPPWLWRVLQRDSAAPFSFILHLKGKLDRAMR